MNEKYDVLIIGAGLAGLYATMNIPSDKKVLVVCKDIPWECNTFYAQGGMATSLNESDVPFHIEDTIAAGADHNDREAVEMLTKTSLATTSHIVELGMQFDTNDEGKLLYTKEAAHSTERIIHAGGDATGRYMHYFMMVQNKHQLQKNQNPR